MNRRRFFLTSLAGALSGVTAPVAVEAQQPKIRRVGVLSPGPAPPLDPFDQRTVFEAALRDFGWVPGTSVSIAYRYAEGDADRLLGYAREFAGLPVDVLVARSSYSIRAARQATKTVPIVMSAALDPVGAGFVASLSRPGGNITGLALRAENVADKQLQLLHEAVPTVSDIGVLYDARIPLGRGVVVTAHALRLNIHDYPVPRASELGRAFTSMKSARIGAVIVGADPLFMDARLKEIASLATGNGLPSISAFREFPDSGGLMSYGADVREIHRRSASFVDKILKGAKPADLPVEQPTKFELVINLKTAKALGLTIPPSLLLRADQVIE
jgi:putative ABC transport system substrate-binding protein